MGLAWRRFEIRDCRFQTRVWRQLEIPNCNFQTRYVPARMRW